MAKREVLGRMACPACDFDAAEIKRQKCGVKLYVHCPECNVQIFARTEQQEKSMRRAIAASEPAAPAIEPAAQEAAPVAAPEKSARLKPEKKEAPAPAPAPAPAKKSGFNFMEMIGGK